LLWRRENYPELFSTYDESLLSDAYVFVTSFFLEILFKPSIPSLKNVTVSESLTKVYKIQSYHW